MELSDFYYYLLPSIYFFFVGLILVFSNKKLFAWKILGYLYLIIGTIFYIFFYLEYPRIYQNVHLFRTAAPLLFLIGPLSYFFQTFLLYPDRNLKKIDLLHFLPFLFHLIEFIPFYLASYEEKLKEIEYVIKHRDYFVSSGKWGLIDIGIQTKLKFISYYSYALVCLFQLIKYYKSITDKFYQKNKLVINLLFFYLFIKIFILSLYSYLHRFGIHRELEHTFPDYLLFLDYIVFSLAMFFKQALFRIFHFQVKSNSLERNKSGIPSSDNLVLIKQLESIMAADKPFLKQALLVEDMTAQLGFSAHKLRNALREEYNISFSDYINLQRIRYAKAQYDLNVAWRSYSLEGIAKSSGFATRYGFISAVKKLKGVTPKEFFVNENVPKHPIASLIQKDQL